MKRRIIPILIVLIVFTFLNVGCGQDKSNSLIEMLKILPQDTAGMRCFDIVSLERDVDLADWYSDLKGDMFFPRVDIIPGINSSDINTSSIVIRLGNLNNIFGNLMMIFQGELDLQGIRDMLSDQGLEESKYEGIEIWTGEPYGGAFLDNMFLLGSVDSVKTSIRVSQNMETSMYDDEDVKHVVEKLSAGIMCTVSQGTTVLEEAGWPAAGQAGGFSLIKAPTGQSLEISGWYIFENAVDAQSALSGIENYMKDLWDTDYIEGQLKGEYIEVTGKMDIPKD